MIIFPDRFQIDSEFRCTQDKESVTILFTLQTNVTPVFQIRIKNKEDMDLAGYTPPNNVIYYTNASNTGMIPWKNGWFIILETNYIESVNVIVDSNLTLWNKTIPVNCGNVFLHYIISSIRQLACVSFCVTVCLVLSVSQNDNSRNNSSRNLKLEYAVLKKKVPSSLT